MDDSDLLRVDTLARKAGKSRAVFAGEMIVEGIECGERVGDVERIKKEYMEMQKEVIRMQTLTGELARKIEEQSDEIKWLKSFSAQLAGKIPDAKALPVPRRSIWSKMGLKRDESK